MIKQRNKFAEILQKYKYKLHSGDIVAGTVMHDEKRGFLVDIGTEHVGYLPKEEVLVNCKNKKNSNLKLINTTRDFFLVTENLYTKQCVLSIKRLDYIRAWKRIKQMYLEDIIFNLTIQHINKGGIITYLEGIQGFIPNSHLCIVKKDFNFQLMKNKQIQCKILTINENKNQLILSHKSASLTLSSHKFKIGELIYGEVIVVKSYGLFMNVHGIKALLHISEIGYINNYVGIFKTGKFIKVKIIHLNNKYGKISVSLRNLKNITTHHQQY
uniref:Ribosomal protein S1 n=1 Tax=Pleurostichidium falkenbergii TaxID=121064 RepID=A0A4D6UWG1_9FLOR|nr:ribosomal protein S1 [Pleurostichidium falkenbergii]QCH39747.1 ribosomal protein S1 [Pleurostichidium falkenbergii]